MLSRVQVEAVGTDVGARFARVLPAALHLDLSGPTADLLACMHQADTAFILDVTGANPLGWSYCLQTGLERLRGAANCVSCLGEQPDPRFTGSVLIPSYIEVLTADQPMVHRVAALANGTFLAYRKLTIPLRQGRHGRANHILTLTELDLALPLLRPRDEAVSRLTSRERQCLSLAASGLAVKQTAAELGISEKTVELHLARARTKVGARTTAHAVAVSMMMALA